MGGGSLPPGFRFHPTDEELVGYYLHRKVQGLEIELEVIPVIELYKFDPWELPEKSFLPKRDMEWFFFCPRDRKYPNGTRTNRATKSGYWKATGKDRKVVCQSSVTGYRKTLVFYRGRAPLGDRTDWVMHEYRLFDESSQSQGTPNFQGAYALCRVIKKNEQAHKASDSHGESKAKTIGSSSSIGDLTAAEICNEPLGISADIPSQTSYPCNNSRYSSPIASPFQVSPFVEYELASLGSNLSNIQVSSDLILDSSKDYPQVQEAMCGYFPLDDYATSMSPWQTKEHQEFSSGYMSPYLGNEDYNGVYGNQDVSYHGYDYADNL